MLYQFEIITCGLAPEIQFTIKFDDQMVGQFSCDNQTHTIDYQITDSDDDRVCTRSFQIIVEGKTQSHTVLNQDGSIKSDCYAIIRKIIFDDIDVTSEYCQGQKIYMHNNNNTSDVINDEFYGFIGCNGTINLIFSTPLHLWMLEQCQ